MSCLTDGLKQFKARLNPVQSDQSFAHASLEASFASDKQKQQLLDALDEVFVLETALAA